MFALPMEAQTCTKKTCLPAGLLNTGNLSFICKFAETDTAEVKITHEALCAATTKATIHCPCAELRLLF